MSIKNASQNLVWEPYPIPANLVSYEELTKQYKIIAPKRDISILSQLEHKIKDCVNCENVAWRPLTEGPISWALGPEFLIQKDKTNIPKDEGKCLIKIYLPFLKKDAGLHELERPIIVHTLGVVTESDVDQVFINLITCFQYYGGLATGDEF